MGTIGPDPEGNKEKVAHPAAAGGAFPGVVAAWAEREWRTLSHEDRVRLAGERVGEAQGHFSPSSRPSHETGPEEARDAASFPGLEFDSVHEGMSARTLLLPGEAMVPEESWYPQHRRALQRCGRGRANQLIVWRVEKAGALTAVREERVDGCDLGSLLAGEGALPWATALAALRRVDWALDHLEGKAGAFPVWWLPADAIQLVTGSRDREESLRRTGLEKPEPWEHLPLRLRLHQRARFLERGGETLPASLRKLCADAERDCLRARRAGILLPLAWRLGTGREFSWERPLRGEERSELAPATREWLESMRRELVENPTGVKEEFLMGLEITLGTPSPSLALADGTALGTPASPPAPADGKAPGAPSPSLAFADDRELESAGEKEKEKEKEKARGPEGFWTEAKPKPEGRAARAGAANQKELQLLEADSVEQEQEQEQDNEDVLVGEKEKEPEQDSFADQECRDAPRSRFRWMLPVVTGTILASLFALVAFDLPVPRRAVALGKSAEEGQPVFPSPGIRPELLATFGTERERIPAEEEWKLRTRPERTVAELIERAERDDAGALRVLGLAALHGRWIPRDAERGRERLRRAAGLDDAAALAVLGERWLAEHAEGGEEAEGKREALLFLQKAATRGDARARYWLGVVLLEGTLVPADPERGFRLVQSAAEQGCRAAFHDLGLCHAAGLGTDADSDKAVAAFRKAVGFGDREAMGHLARCCEKGFGTAFSRERAERWRRLAGGSVRDLR